MDEHCWSISGTVEKIFQILGEDECKEKEELCGLRHVLEKIYSQPKALAVMQELTDLLGASGPHPCDPVFEVLNYEKRLYAVGDSVEKIIARAIKKRDELPLKEVVVHAFPSRIVKYESRVEPIKYKIELKTAGNHRITLGPAMLPEIVAQLKQTPLVTHREQSTVRS